MSTDYTSDGLLLFLREAALAGRMTPAVARSRRSAAQALFEKLSDREAVDLRQLDVDALSSRFHDIQGGGLRSEVVELYAGRLRGALDDYFRYVDDPDGFVAVTARTQTTARREERSPRTADQRALETVRLTGATQRPDVIPIPLKQGRVVYLHGVPADLSASEARKIARVVEALAEEPGNEH